MLQPRLTEWIPHKPTPKQAAFMVLPHLEAGYGGSAGGGKSDALLMAALQWVDVPGYAALLLRRTYADLALPGALMDRARAWLGGSSAHWNDTAKTWRFPSGATLSFGYLQTEQDKYRYQSAEFQYCAVPGTPVLMSNGAWRPIEQVQLGDLVATLEGPRPVLAVHRPGVKSTVRISTVYGSARVGTNHGVMLSDGAWGVPKALLATRCYSFDSSGESSSPPLLAAYTRRERTPSDRLLVGEPVAQTTQEMAHAGFGASSANDRNGCVGFDDVPQESSLPPRWYGHLALLARASPLGDLAGYEGGGGRRGALPASWPIDCQTDRHYSGEHIHPVSTVAPDGIRPPSGVGACIQTSWHVDDRGRIPGCNLRSYAHPYTKAIRACSEAVRPVAACIAPADEAAVCDLTVASASHYIVWPGLIIQNCGFDELTQFSEPMYRFLFSRLRRLVAAAVPIRMRWASNPGGVGHDWVKRRMIDEGPAHGRPFIPARLADNPYLDRDEYLRSLAELDPVTRAQLLDGSWIAAPAGALFRRAWFDIEDARPVNVRARVRYWDLAGTKPKPGRDPDYTAGARVSRTPEGIWYIEHMVRMRGAPHEVEQAIRQAAIEDGRDVEVWLEQEPGASGIIVIDHYVREVLPGWIVQGQRSTGDKVTRAKPVAAQAANGNVRLVVGAWLTAFLDEAAAFPLGSNDDQIDAVSGGFARLADAIPAAMVGQGERAEADGDAGDEAAALRTRLRAGEDAAYVLPSQRARFWR